MSYKEDLFQASQKTLPWEKLRDCNILVTGATGLIGSTIVQILLKRAEFDGFHVYAAGRNEDRANKLFEDYLSSPYYHFLKFDVRKTPEFDIDFHFIISAASSANPVLYSIDPVGVMLDNIYGVDNLLNYGIKHCIKRFLYVSSGDVYGECKESLISEECSGYSDPLNLRSCYVSAKRASETLCISYSTQYNVDTIIVRPCHTYGPNFTESDSRAYAQFLRNILNNENIVMKSSGEQMRSWCYSVDCALGIIFALFKGDNRSAYNIADDNSIFSIKEFATVMANLGGVDIVFQQASEIEKKGFNLVKTSIFDTSKLRNLGWTISGSFQEKMNSTIRECVMQK